MSTSLMCSRSAGGTQHLQLPFSIPLPSLALPLSQSTGAVSRLRFTQSSPNPVFLLCIAHKLNGKKEGGKLLREGKHGRREDDTVPLGGTAGMEPRCPQPHHHAAKNTHSPPKPSATERVKKLPRQTPCHRTVSMPVMTSGSSEMLFLEKYLSC